MNTSMLLRSISTVKSTVLSFAVELRKEKMNIASFIWILRSLRFFKYSIFLQNIIFFLKIIDFFSLFLSEPFIFFKCYGSVRFSLVRFSSVHWTELNLLNRTIFTKVNPCQNHRQCCFLERTSKIYAKVHLLSRWTIGEPSGNQLNLAKLRYFRKVQLAGSGGS